MSARALLFSLPWLLFAGCLQHRAPGTTPCPTVSDAQRRPALTPPPSTATPAPHEFVWKLRSDDQSAWNELPAELQTFSIGRWECALGDEQPDDVLRADATELARTRRLACTHATGATVQTQLSCTLDSEPSARSGSSPATRELTLSLDSAAPLRLACEAR